MWRGPGGSSERATLDQITDGWRLAGTTLLSLDDGPFEIRYSVILDAEWRPRTVGAHVQGPAGDRRMALTGGGEGGWTVTDQPILELFGATDVDLAWTPATNTLPIRRLGLDVGETGSIVAVRVAFPEHEIERVTQHYERTGPDTYRYRSGDFVGELVVDEHGLVVDYAGLWTATSRG